MATFAFWDGGHSEFYDAGKDKFSATAGKIARDSIENSPFAVARWTWEWHRSDRLWRIRERFGRILTNFSWWTDGVWTKVVSHSSSRQHWIAAHDLGAMTLDDAIRNGDYPILFSNLLDARSVSEDEDGFVRMLEELWKIAQEQSIILYAWETANLGACVSTPDLESKSAFNWAGFVDTVKHPLIHSPLGNLTNFWKIEPGNIVVALEQGWFRSNGISAVRRAFEAEYWPNWYREAPRDKFNDAFQASKIYCRAVWEAMGWFNRDLSKTQVLEDADFAFQVDIRGIAHLSGGSFEGKFYDALLKPNNVSAVLNNLYPTPDIVKEVYTWQQKIPEKLGRKSDVTSIESVYKTFCSWQGMLCVLSDLNEAEKFLTIVGGKWVNWRVVGEITETWKNGSMLHITGNQIWVN